MHDQTEGYHRVELAISSNLIIKAYLLKHFKPIT